MKKYLHIALMLLCVFVVSSCKDDDDDTEAVSYTHLTLPTNREV